jgi:serine phosphatase RsbU (regulator of sigma subunit)
VGLLVFAGGLALARRWLPEWRGEVRGRDFYVQRYRALARQTGVRLASDAPTLSLISEEPDDDERLAGTPDPNAGLRTQVTGDAGPPAASSGLGWQWKVEFAPRGQPLALSWTPVLKVNPPRRAPANAPRQRVEAFARLLLAPGERLGERRGNEDGTSASYALVGSQPPQHLEASTPTSGAVTIERELGGIEPQPDEDNIQELLFVLLFALPRGLGVLLIAGVFLFLLSRRRIGAANGVFLAALSLAASALAILGNLTWSEVLGTILPSLFLSLWIVAAWSAGESLLRSQQPNFTTSLDALRLGRLGPRGGRALLYGAALGAVLAGLRLSLLAGAEAFPGIGSAGLSLRVPPLGGVNPFSAGILLAVAVTVALALVSRLLPRRLAGWAAALLAGAALTMVLIRLTPWPFGVAADVLAAGFLIWVLKRFGLTALAAAAVCSFLLPEAVFSALHLTWLPVHFAVTAGSFAALLVFGFVGLGRSEQIELEGRRLPAFIRRMEEERRLKYEMDLLARMQLGLLPSKLPEVEGWEIAARSLLATEAGGDLYDFLRDDEGRLWIAAGDVAGHGYSCSIAQAMTVAALTSLINAARTPAEVLGGIDRVLRRGSQRNFTSLALVRLDSRTGEALMSNAGHPFPLLLLGAAGGVEEIDLPGLPLGQGPPRQYADLRFDIPPGSSLVFSSDGLFEAADWREALYGYDRPREILRSLGDRPAAEILEALFADWRRHLGAREHQDDTTVVVVKRAATTASQ